LFLGHEGGSCGVCGISMFFAAQKTNTIFIKDRQMISSGDWSNITTEKFFLLH
jgi:hypothetical protein